MIRKSSPLYYLEPGKFRHTERLQRAKRISRKSKRAVH